MSADSVINDPDTSEMYYAHMEADRNEAVAAYFAARPALLGDDIEEKRKLFCAGYERAYRKLWEAVIRGGFKS